MLKIRALNREASSDEDLPVIRREAQEEIVLEEYNKALRLQSTGNYDEAETILFNLINENVPQLENNGGLPHSISTIKYSCYLNIGNICMKSGKLNDALDNYLQASELDDTDVTLWYKIGTLAIKQNRFKQAAYALAKGLECSESHWPCLDQLISLLYAMKDTISCLLYIGRALNLDNNYTKGLVLRKQIYKDNPATLEYYQAYNPNYIWEPSLNIEIDEEEVRLILDKEQILCDRISEFEKSLRPKPLQIIPLPKALNDFTWISFGKTVTYLHQFLTDHNMTHFTMVDINKCMKHEESNGVVSTTAPVDEVVENTEKPPDDPVIDKTENEVIDDDKMESEQILERRPSQNSDNNNDGQENTPIQTDNDDEQAVEQDGYDQEEIDNKSDKTKSLNTNKSNKRKRDLLSDLQIWGWHSKRKSAKKGKSDKDLTVEDALNRILPNTLLKNKVEEKFNTFEDSMNTMDIYNMYVENRHVNILSPIHSPKSVNLEEYFGTDRESADVKNLWFKDRKYYDATILIKDFVVSLSKLWHTQWPKDLIQLYIDAYNMYREHYDHPQPFNDDFTFDELKEDAMITLLYGELINFSSTKSETRFIHVTSLAFLQTISGWSDEWQDDYINFFTRFYWLRCHIFRKEGNYELAIQSLELIQEVINDEETKIGENFFLYLPNCYKCGLITKDVTMKILRHLNMITSLNCLEDLFANEKYQEVADILKLTFNISSRAISGKMGRPAELALLLHSLWYTNLTECFKWTEECLYEALGHFLRPSDNYDKWEKFLMKCLEFLHEIIKMETVIIVDALDEQRRARLVETLAKIICKQLNSENISTLPLGSVIPWMLLHYILTREEHRQQAGRKISHIKRDKNEDIDIDVNDDLPSSIAILFSAHEFLGPKGWCLINNGELLHFILDTVLDRLDTPVLENLREKVDIHIEQALFCLYQHPSKKNKISRHLADHNVDPLPLTWERAFQLYEFYGPDCLPEFNSYKNVSITSDLEQLLQRIIALVPNECDPQPHMSKLSEYIQGKVNELPEPITFPYKVRDIYYLIGDYYFKQREFTRCIKYFMMDLCINPLRVDSWACIALSYMAQLEIKLNFCKQIKTETKFLDKAKCAQISFRKALELADNHIMLWIEFGSFEYMVHSFCSRLMKTESDTLSMEKFEYLEAQKNSYLESSGRSFEKAIELYQPDETEADERWLQYYILGKVAEKQQKEPNEYLQYYATAGKLLHENNALYPDKINYHNPQHLSVEALEMHYRVNASILKYLELHEGKDIPNSLGNFFKQQLDKSYFPKKSLIKQSFQTNGTNSCFTTTNGNSNEILVEVKKCLNDILDKIDEQDGKKMIRQNSIDECSDVIMISDSDDEQMKINSEQNVRKNVQELFDKVREEVMKKNEEQEPDSDASTTTTSKQITDNKSEDVKSDRTDQKLKSGSETDDIRTSIDESSSSPSSSSSSSSSSNSDSDDDSSSSASSSSSETTNRNMSQNEILSLIDRCIVGLEQCIIRLPQNYKALYRLAHLFFNYKAKRDLNKCRQLLLGEYTCKGGIVIAGLFSDRKNHNFFNGIWRIPSSEIDRPGSLSAHMSRCVALLLQILRATNDNKTLLDLSLQFRKAPDQDKIYIKDSERLQFADQAMAMCIQSLRSQMQNLSNMNDTAVQRLLQDIYRSLQRVQKIDPAKEATFSSMLSELFKKWKKDTVTDNVNVLDLATKFCQQNRLVEKQKRQMQRQTAVLRSPTVPNAPVLPAPASVTPTTQPPLKRPGMSRPRGRPPLPKVPGQNRPPKNRNLNLPTNLYQWSNSKFMQEAALSYFKQYQEELIKQYSQNLNFNQLSQLNQYLTQNQLNSFTQNQFTSQFISNQNMLLNNPNLLKQMALGQYLSQLSETTKTSSGFKSSSDSLSMGNPGGLSADFMKNFPIDTATSSKSSSSSYKKNLPHTITQPSQSATKTKAHPSTNLFGLNLPQSSANKPTKTEKKSTIPHTVTSAKSAFTPVPYKSYANSGNLSTVDSNKIKSRPTMPASKTTSDLQIFKEPTVTKAHSSLHKNIEKAANILMKDRPNISITPVMSANPINITSFLPTSPGKTLQEKLADRQKQLSTKQLTKNIEAEIITKDSSTTKKINIPSIPASLSPSSTSSSTTGFKPSQLKFSLDSGISISQLPAVQSYKTSETMKHSSSKVKPVREINTSSNVPMSLSLAKKQQEKRKSSDDDDVICID